MPGIYVHIPFCKHKCTYCDFVSFAGKDGEAENYFNNLYHELMYRAQQAKGVTFDTVYFGGGTPSFVDAVYITAALTLIKREFRIAENAEITIEMNPGTVTEEKLQAYKKAGFNRFSVGFQTANDDELLRLNRIHTKADFIETAKLLEGENFSADVMIGLHDESEEDVLESLRIALNYGASHVSVYALTPADGTPIYTDYLNGELPDGDEVAERYETCVKYLQSRGVFRYEVSNFAKPGMESRHNLNYWKRGEYLGFGIAAHSFFGGKRFANTENFKEYDLALKNERFPVVYEEEITEKEAEEEFVMLALRTEAGIDYAAYKKAFNEDFPVKYERKLQKLAPFFRETEKGIALLPEKMYVQDGIVLELLSE